jgi:predicted aspartyl protease
MSSGSGQRRVRGQITDGTPTIALRVVDPSPRLLRTVVVDTGFPGGIVLPTGSFTEFGITPDGEGPVALADGSERLCPFAYLTVEWLDGAREITAHELEGSQVLMGMELLDGTRVELRSPHLTISPL